MQVLYLFRRDLRLRDHAGLAQAAALGAVVPALVFDSGTRARLARSPRRAAFFCDALASLAADLREARTPLVVRRGPLLSSVKRLARETQAGAVVWASAYDAATVERQRNLQRSLEEASLRAHVVHDAPAAPPEETAAARSAEGGLGYRALGPYLAAWRASRRLPVSAQPRFVDANVASDPLPSRDELGAAPSGADETASERGALEALERYLSGPALQYRTARNVPSGEPTARISVALSFGTLAARTVLARIDERLHDPFLLAEERLSLETLVQALAARDFFLQLAWFFEDQPDRVLQPRMRGFRFAPAHAALKVWREGRTGFPLVDAGLRQLRETGWMHPRVRAVAASFLCFDLGVDWRAGRDAWDAWLTEDEPALATGNWQWIAGVGADLAAYPRIYNPLKQARRFDPAAKYVRRWIPELAALPDAAILDPLVGRHERQLQLALFGERDYPLPVLDHEAAARAFLQRYTREVRTPA